MLLRIVTITIFAIVIGSSASLAAIGFVTLVEWLNNALLISPRSRIMATDSIWLLIATVAVPALGGLVVGLLWHYIPEKRPHGPPDAIRSVQTLDGTLPTKSGLITAAGSIISLGSGASVGQYGPLVHLGATIGAWFGRMFNDSRYFGVIGIGCGAAAAIATAFNAPIAGLVFAHEVILRHYSLRAFAPVTVAATIGYVVANHIFEQSPLFRINPITLNNSGEYIGFILIGIAGALVAVIFMRAVLLAAKLAASWQVPLYLKPMSAGLILGFTALWLPEVLGVGKEVLRFATIENAFGLSELVVLLMAKIIMTALCIGFGFAGGVFSPALLIGILFGAFVGSGAELLLGDTRSHIALYAVCGMVAVTSPVIGAPLTTILIVFELTRNYDLAMACMVSVVFANLVAYRLFGRSLFDVQLASRGVDLRLGRDKAVLDNRPITSYISQSYTKVAPQQTLLQVRAVLIANQANEAYVVDDTGRYLGTLSLQEILHLEQQGTPAASRASDFAKPEKLVFYSDSTIWNAMEQMGDFVGESIPVINNEDEKILSGVIFEAALIKAYLEALHNIRREEHAAS